MAKDVGSITEQYFRDKFESTLALQQATARAQLADQMFKVRLGMAKDSLETQGAEVKARNASMAAQAKMDNESGGGGGGQQTDPMQEMVAAMGAQQAPLQARGQQQGQATFDQAVSALPPAAATSGGRAVQASSGLQQQPQGGPGQQYQVNPFNVSQRTTEETTPVNLGDVTYFAPTTRRETTVEPNQISAAQAAQLQQQDRQFAVESKRYDEKLRIDTMRELLRDSPSLGPKAADAASALIRGDNEAFYKAAGASLEKDAAARDKLQDLAIQKAYSEINRANAQTALALFNMTGKTPTMLPSVLYGLRGAEDAVNAVKNPLTEGQIATISAGLFKDGKFVETQTPNLRAVQNAYFDKGQLYLATEGSFGGGTFGVGSPQSAEVVPIRSMLNDMRIFYSNASEEERRAAVERISSVKINGKSAIKLSPEGEFVAAEPKMNGRVVKAANAWATSQALVEDKVQAAQQPNPNAEPALGSEPAKPKDLPMLRSELQGLQAQNRVVIRERDRLLKIVRENDDPDVQAAARRALTELYYGQKTQDRAKSIAETSVAVQEAEAAEARARGDKLLKEAEAALGR